MTHPLLLSVREAAAELGIGRDTAYRLVREGRLRSVSVGRKVLVPRIELAAFVEREMGGEAMNVEPIRSGARDRNDERRAG